MQPVIRTAALALAFVALVSAAVAQPASAPGGGSTAARFLVQAGAGGAAEIALGRLASQQASREDVRQFGRKMVEDHGRTQAELKQLSGAKGLVVPDSPTPAQQKVAERLAGLAGDPFDRSYLNRMALDHTDTIALFRREARAGRDPELKAFAARTLPALQEHLAMVRSLQTKGGPMNRVENERK